MDAFLDPHPEWITIGGPDHLVYVGGLVLLATLLITLRARVRAHATAVRRCLAAVLVVQQVTLYGFYAATGWDNAESLPLHISRVSALLALTYLLTGSRRVMDVLFYFGLWAWASFSYPQNIQPVDNILGWSFFVNHAVTLLMPVLAFVTTGWLPTRAGLWRAFAWFLAYLGVAVVANALTGGNYFYQRERPLLPWLGQPWYLLASLAATLVLFALGYALARLLAARAGVRQEDRPGTKVVPGRSRW
ncbi:YwaF family protein [Ornithinimicrobium avium]|uniref:TIGR02206 family membrane protein n=1 Tax=Ornithinimicrobium avium TaxID=2283195 RepID=A0A345NSB7_9MICO|nr:TIGR02206 family membrane protein [Ornithinimicrobium avium]AXH97925.1 TIGR02206 family membrane protein [Ornithinimicrobium avium]